MTEPYLIAHVVRGQPAFDIAERIQIGDEEGWIIPTSGHRAYPLWAEPLMASMSPREQAPTTLDIYWVCDQPAFGYGTASVQTTDHPDHFAPSAAPRGTGLITNLAERLGLLPKPPTITRR
jgi:hypothetical protein